MTQPAPPSAASLWQDIRAHLEGMRRVVMREIRSYPQPIAGCDAQIPVLWERRDAISAELARLDTVASDPSPEAVAAFLSASPVIDEPDRRRLFGEKAAHIRTVPEAARAAAE